jgi:hypothetical protein
VLGLRQNRQSRHGDSGRGGGMIVGGNCYGERQARAKETRRPRLHARARY